MHSAHKQKQYLERFVHYRHVAEDHTKYSLAFAYLFGHYGVANLMTVYLPVMFWNWFSAIRLPHTVFTAVGSVENRWITVYNPTNRDMLLDEVKLNQANGAFRLNIDGMPGNQASDVLIPSKDSIYIFAEVTVTPTIPPIL